MNDFAYIARRLNKYARENFTIEVLSKMQHYNYDLRSGEKNVLHLHLTSFVLMIEATYNLAAIKYRNGCITRMSESLFHV